MILNVPNNDAQAFKDVKVFAGDNFFPPADGSYSNLIWESFPRSKACPADWSQFGGECYKYFDNSVKWDDAREHCLSEEVVILLLDCLLNLSFFTSG